MKVLWGPLVDSRILVSLSNNENLTRQIITMITKDTRADFSPLWNKSLTRSFTQHCPSGPLFYSSPKTVQVKESKHMALNIKLKQQQQNGTEWWVQLKHNCHCSLWA